VQLWIVSVELSADRHTEVVQHFRNGRWRRRGCLLTAPDHRLENNGKTASSSGVRPASAQDAVAEMAARTGGLRATHEWLVLERDDRIIGFAYGQPVKRLATFQWSAETGIYVDVDNHRAGAGRELYTQPAAARRARLPASLRRHHSTQRGQQRPSSILRVPGRRLIPARGMEARPLARRDMYATRSA
jgi:hypothetical protein